MYSNNKFAKMDSIANLIKTILEADTKAKMEELKGGQHKIDKNKNNKIDAQDFAILRGEKKAMKKEDSEQTNEEAISEGRPYSAMHRIGRYGSTRRYSPTGYGTTTGNAPTAAPAKPSKPASEPAKDMKKEDVEQFDEARVKGRGYDNPENERKAPEGNAPVTSLMPGHDERAAKFLARQAKGKLVKGKAQSAPQKEEVEQVDEMKAGVSAGKENKFHKKLDKLVHGTFGASSDEKKMKKEEIDPKKTVVDTLKGREKTSTNPFLSKKVMMDVPGNVKEESEQVVEAEKWIQKAIKKPGALRAQMGVEKGEKIPKGKLAAAAKEGGKLGQRARLAKTLSSLRKKK